MVAFDEDIVAGGYPHETGSLLELTQQTWVGVREDGQGLDKEFELLGGNHEVI
jgi:hypothetical protein